MIEPEYKFREKYRVPSNRLQNHDYSSDGAYFITVCTKNRENYFGEIKDGMMVLNDVGEIAEKFLQEIPDHFQNVSIDTFIIMPNHVHMVVMIENTIRHDVETRRGASLQGGSLRQFGPLIPKSISSIINHYKGKITKYAKSKDIQFFWQSNYHDHIIRDENELNRVRQYIHDNLSQWEDDEENVANIKIP